MSTKEEPRKLIDLNETTKWADECILYDVKRNGEVCFNLKDTKQEISWALMAAYYRGFTDGRTIREERHGKSKRDESTLICECGGLHADTTSDDR